MLILGRNHHSPIVDHEVIGAHSVVAESSVDIDDVPITNRVGQSVGKRGRASDRDTLPRSAQDAVEVLKLGRVDRNGLDVVFAA